MITPPQNQPVFYSALLEETAASFVLGLLAPQSAMFGDVEQVMVTSLDFTSDITATVELKEAAQEIAFHLVDIDEEIDVAEKYNPIYLAKKGDKIYDDVVIDHEGDIIEIQGFADPFVTMSLNVSIEDAPNVISAKVKYKQFQLDDSLPDVLEREVTLS